MVTWPALSSIFSVISLDIIHTWYIILKSVLPLSCVDLLVIITCNDLCLHHWVTQCFMFCEEYNITFVHHKPCTCSGVNHLTILYQFEDINQATHCFQPTVAVVPGTYLPRPCHMIPTTATKPVATATSLLFWDHGYAEISAQLWS